MINFIAKLVPVSTLFMFIAVTAGVRCGLDDFTLFYAKMRHVIFETRAFQIQYTR